MKTVKILVISIFLTLGLAPVAGAVSYTDSDLSPGNDITYSLTYSGGPTYPATFTITNSSDASPEWYVGWFTFKFHPGTEAKISDLVPPGGTSGWQIANPGSPVELLQGGGGNYQPLLQGGSGEAGIYNTGYEDPATADAGILVTGTPATTTFTFKFEIAEGAAVAAVIPFKVGYYGPRIGPQGEPSIAWSQLSQELTGNGNGNGNGVPEPATILMLGAGLLGLGLFSRKRSKK